MNDALQMPRVYKAVNSILSSLASYQDIKIVFSGRPCTDGKTVYLGEPPMSSQEALEAYLVHGTHEIHHVLYTDFEQIRTLGPIFRLVNALEDVRIDSIGYKTFPGTYYWRETYLEKLAAKNRLPQVSPDMSPGALLCLTLFWTMTEERLGYSMSEKLAEESKVAFVDRFGLKIYEELCEIARKAVTAPDTNTLIEICRVLAKRFSRFLQQAHAETRSDCTKSEIKQNLETDSQAETSGEDASQMGCSPSETSEESADDESYEKIFAAQDLKDIDLHERISEEMESYRAREGARDHSREDSFAVWQSKKNESACSFDPNFEADLKRLTAMSSRRFRRFLNAMVYAPGGLRRSGKRICSSALSRIRVGDDRVFFSEEPRPRPSAAFSILIDRSGSMDRKTMRTAAICAYSLAQMISSVEGCACNALAFPGIERQTLLEVKGFNERVESNITRFMGLRSFGCTPVCQSLNTAAAHLFGRREKRRVIFVITDGLCAEEETLKAAAERLEKSGIEIVCLGIGSTSPKIFKNQKNIHDAHEMPDAVYRLFEETFKKSFAA